MTKRLAIATACCLLMVLCAACGQSDSGARAQYNRALGTLEQGDFEAAQKQLLEARDNAGNDPELRFRAAFALALAHARAAEGQQEPQAALDQLQQAAAWFRDAVNLQPDGTDGDDARANLEIVLLRIDALTDQLNKGENSLEARLERVIEDQRSARDRIRKLIADVDAAGASAEPAAFQSEFDALATFERTLLAEVGVISDLAGDELDAIQNKTEQERTDEDRMRSVQLSNLATYLQSGRVGVADARRFLRRLQGDSAHRRADAALGALKRAREQLQDPVTVLRGIAEDEAVVHMHTRALLALSEAGADADAEPRPAAPAWLTAEHLGERQELLGQRTDELAARLEAGVNAADADAGPSAAGDQPAPQQDPEQARLMEAVRAALPFVRGARADMSAVVEALAAARLSDAVAGETRALEALAAAIERFADLRSLIELTYAEQNQVVALLDQAPANPAPDAPTRPEPTIAERLAALGESLTRQSDRLARLEGLLADEKAKVAQQAAQARQQAQTQGAGEEQLAQLDAETAAQTRRFDTADELRTKALASIDALAAAVADIQRRPAQWQPGAPGPLAPARDALASIEELRRLFFSVIEHLQELLRHQTETRDDTASAANRAGEELAGALGPLGGRQRRHEQMSSAISEALAQQADAAAQAPAQGPAPQGQDPAEMAKKLAEAADEVRGATVEMAGAGDLLEQGAQEAAQASWDLEPTLDRQGKAIERLARALELLQPPPPPQQDQNQDQQDQQQQQQQQQQQMSQQQADRRLQRARESEAERQRRRRQQQRMQNEPVEKDW